MTTATLLLTSLLASAAPPPNAEFINAASMELPIRIDDKQRPLIKELILFVSDNGGKQWQQVAVAPRDATKFDFSATADGVYQLCVCSVDLQGNSNPSSPYKADPASINVIVVDTIRPELKITAQRVGEEVVASWDIREEYPDLKTLKLEYRAADNPAAPWNFVGVSQQAQGQTTFRPGPGPLVVRMVAQDLAKNQAVAQTEVAGVALANRTVEPTAASAPPPSGPPPVPPPLPPGGGWDKQPPSGAAATFAGHQTDQPPPEPVQGPARAPVEQPPPPRSPAEMAPAPPARAPQTDPSWGPLGNGPVQPAPGAGGAGVPVASTLRQNGGRPAAQTPFPGPRTEPGTVQVINKKQLTIDYQVSKFGPSGVKTVELYLTKNNGTTWEMYGGFQEGTGSGLPDVTTPGNPVKSSLTVDLPDEGVYGFYLIVKSGAGLGKPPPTPGTPPQKLVQVDLTHPEAELYQPEADNGKPNVLVLTWMVRDNLGLPDRPVTLEWTDNPKAGWKPIAADLPARPGRYAWQLPPTGLPPYVYLRLTVRDTAGNVSVIATEQPVLVDMHIPEVNLEQIK